MKAFGKIIIFLILFFVTGTLFVSQLGNLLRSNFNVNKKNAEEVVITYPSNNEICDVLDTAHEKAYDYAANALDEWIAEMMIRVDEDFINDYFSFINVKKREISAVYHSTVHFFNKSSATAEEVASRELEDELSRKVIKPEISQAKIKNIMDNAVSIYMETLDTGFSNLQSEYQIPTPEWNNYISDICGITMDSEQKNYPFKFKLLVASGVALTGITTVSFVAPLVKKVMTKVSTRIVARVAAKASAKAGTKIIASTATKAGTKAVAASFNVVPIIGLGVTAAICIWDIADYAYNASKGKKMLRQNLSEYFAEVKAEMLSDSESSIMGCLSNFENSLKRNMPIN